MTTPQRPVLPPRPADELPTGYRIAESGVPDVPPKYQVLHGRGRDVQYIGMRETREGRPNWLGKYDGWAGHSLTNESLHLGATRRRTETFRDGSARRGWTDGGPVVP